MQILQHLFRCLCGNIRLKFEAASEADDAFDRPATQALFMPENFRQRVRREFFKKFVQPVEDEYLTKFPEMDQASYVRKATNAVFKRARVEKG